MVRAQRRPSTQASYATLRGVSDLTESARPGRTVQANGARHQALSADDLVGLTGGRLIRDSLRPIRGAAVDSRLTRPGELFVALPGERTDGHRFLREAVMAGAAALIVSSDPDDATLALIGDVTIVAVSNPIGALHDGRPELIQHKVLQVGEDGVVFFSFCFGCLSFFVFVILLLLAVKLLTGLHLRRVLSELKEPLFLAFSTTSSESALPKAMQAMERLGVPPHIVGFVIPAGYSFNLDGTTLYLALASLFIAQAAGIHMSIEQQLVMMGTLLLTSKGVAAVPRASLHVVWRDYSWW